MKKKYILRLFYSILNILDFILFYSIIAILLYVLLTILLVMYIKITGDITFITGICKNNILYYNEPNDIETAGDYKNFGVILKDKLKRRFIWHMFESDNIKYTSYSDFKKSIDSNLNLYSYVKNGIHEDMRKISVHKNTLKLFLSGLNPRNVRR